MTAIKSIEIESLQRLKNITVNFEESGVTAIMGANGSGKTTLLQALACIYKKRENLGEPLKSKQVNYRYQDFFKTYQNRDWIGSKFNVEFKHKEEKVEYSKSAAGWSPQTQHKLHRYVKYINISECVPHQELDFDAADLGMINFDDIDLSAAKKSSLIQSISGVLNRQYIDAGYGSKAEGLENFFFAKTTKRTGNEELLYPSHYMGTGEQKIIYILKEVLQAPPSSLILIEELDFALHESATRALISILIQEAKERDLQIVFTTHWLGIKSFATDIKICSLCESEVTQEVELHERFDPQFIFSIDGDHDNLRQIKVWVEDSLAARILDLVGQSLNIRQFMSIKEFGSIQNAYTVASATAMSGSELDRTIICTDGDRYRTLAEKQIQIGQKIASKGERDEAWKSIALGLIVDFDTPESFQPEKVLLDICKSRRHEENFPRWLNDDITWIERQIPIVDGKKAFNSLRLYKDIDMSELERNFLNEAVRTEAWSNYIRPVVDKLNAISTNLGINLTEVAA